VELFNVRYYRDLKMWVRGHSRSLKMAPFDRSHTSSSFHSNYDAILYRLWDIASY